MYLSVTVKHDEVLSNFFWTRLIFYIAFVKLFEMLLTTVFSTTLEKTGFSDCNIKAALTHRDLTESTGWVSDKPMGRVPFPTSLCSIWI